MWAAAQLLRHLAFYRRPARRRVRTGDRRRRPSIAVCRHVLVEEVESGRLVCCFRLLRLMDGGEIGR
jgi:L-ornithine Nalpha-acyltransferase